MPAWATTARWAARASLHKSNFSPSTWSSRKASLGSLATDTEAMSRERSVSSARCGSSS
jgi:hypothetical protein